MNTKEYCESISDFIGAEEGVYFNPHSMYEQFEKDMDSQWGWLMKGIDAIEGCEDEAGRHYNVKIEGHSVDIPLGDISLRGQPSKKLAVYKALIFFIDRCYNNDKKFMCWWGETKGFPLVHHGVDIKGSEHFSSNNGYSEGDIQEVLDLGLHESASFNNASHVVTRIK